VNILVDWFSFAYAVAGDTELRGALQAVYHDRRHPSHVLLPVIPRAARR
jgi:predicted acyl esterase